MGDEGGSGGGGRGMQGLWPELCSHLASHVFKVFKYTDILSCVVIMIITNTLVP